MGTSGNGFPSIGLPPDLGGGGPIGEQEERRRRSQRQQERLRRQRETMARVGAGASANEGRSIQAAADQTAQYGDKVEMNISPRDERSLPGKIFDFVDENIAQPVAALGLATLPVHTLFGIDGETERVKRTQSLINEVLTGRKSWSQGWDELATIQKERPFALQLGSELLFDPLNLIPGKVFTTPFMGAAKGIRGLSKIKRAGNLTDEGAESVTASADEALLGERIAGVSDPEEIENVVSGKYRINEKEFGTVVPKEEDDFFRKVSQYPGIRKVVGLVAPAYLVDMSSNVTSNGGFNLKKFLTSLMFYQEQTRASAKIDQSKLFRNWRFRNADGNMESLFAQDERTGALLNIVRRVTRAGVPVNLPLSSERVKGFLPDLFTGRITPQQIASRSGIAVKRLETVRKRARQQAVKELLSDPARRKQLLDQWSSEIGRVIPNPSADATTLIQKDIAVILNDADVMRRIERILANPRTQMLPEGGLDRIREFAVGTIIKSERGDLDRLAGFAPRLADLNLGAEALRRDDIFFNEVVQNPSMFELTASQRQFIDELTQHYTDLKNYMVSKGVKPDSEIFGDDVPGNYFSNIWQMGMGLGLRRGVQEGAILGQKKGLENTRLYDYAADAMDEGYRPIDIEDTVRISTQGIYQMVAEKHLMEMAGGWTGDMAKRIQDGGRVYEEDLLKLQSMSQKEKLLIQKALQKTSPGWIKSMNNASSALRTIQSGFDMGAPFIHGLPLLLTNPAAWTRSYKHALNAMIDPQSMRRFQADHYDSLREMNERNILGIGDMEYMEGLEAGGLVQRNFSYLSGVGAERGRLAKLGASPIRGVGKTGRKAAAGAERHFEGWLIGSKVGMWESLRPNALKKASNKAKKVNRDMTSPEYLAAYAIEEKRALDQLAAHVGKMTGTVSMANLGIGMTQRRMISGLLMYAPRYRMATYGMMVDLTRGNYQATLAAKQVSNLLASGAMYYAYTAQKLNQPVYLDPVNAGGKFMTVEVGGSRIGLGSAWLSTVSFLGSLVAENTNDDDPLSTLKVWDGDSAVTKMIRGQISPIGGIGWDVITGRDYMGNPIRENFLDPSQITDTVGNYALPFFISGMLEHPMPGWGLSHEDSLEGDMANVIDPTWGEWLGGIASGATAEFGGLRSYPTSRYERGTELANRTLQDIVQNPDDPRHAEYINLFRTDAQTLAMLKETGRDISDLNWDDLNGAQRDQLKIIAPDITALHDADNKVWASRGPVLQRRVQEYRNVRLSYKKDYDKDISDLSEKVGQLEDPDDPTSIFGLGDFRRELGELGRRNAQRYKDLIDPALEGNYADAAEALESELGNVNVPQEDLAYIAYITDVVAGDYSNELGLGFDYDQRDAAEREWKRMYTGSEDGIDPKTGTTHELLKYVEHRINHDQNRYVRELRQGQKMLRPYWEVPELIMTNMGMESYIPIYKSYKRQDFLSDQERMILENPWIKSVDSASTLARTQMREQFQSVDAFLYRWGYPGNLKNPLNLTTPEADIRREPVKIVW